VIGARFKGCDNSGGARTSCLGIGPWKNGALWNGPNSTFSLPRSSALPLLPEFALVYFSDGFNCARLVGGISATVSSMLTAA